jgi:ADP-ribosylglycohydrolase
MPTQQLPRAVVQRRFGEIDRFHDGPPENEISAGMPAGMVTDDTEQAVLVARAIVDGGGTVDYADFAASLRAWERMASARGGEQLGPSTRRALDALAAGRPYDEVGRRGDTNGAAMRIAPVGIAAGIADLDALVDMVEGASALTHNTGLAISGAAAVAAAVSAAIEGVDGDETIEVAGRAADLGSSRGAYSAGARVDRRIRAAVDLAHTEKEELSFLDEVCDLIGTGVATQESVPAAFALAARWPDDPWRACCAAAGLGGDSDTVGAIVGALLGARVGVRALPADAVETVRRVNSFAPEPLVDDLLKLRAR